LIAAEFARIRHEVFLPLVIGACFEHTIAPRTRTKKTTKECFAGPHRRPLLMTTPTYAPELLVQTWFNTDRPLLLSGLRGQVVVLAAFQVLCPNSIGGGIPQAQRIFETFEPKDVVVIGLHATFE